MHGSHAPVSYTHLDVYKRQSYDSVQVSPDAVGHGTVGFVQMTDGHDIADVAQDDTGQLRSLIHIEMCIRDRSCVPAKR